MNKARFQIAKADIIRFFDELPTKIHRQSDIAGYLTKQREFWRLSFDTTTGKFIKLLIEAGRLAKFDFPFPPLTSARFVMLGERFPFTRSCKRSNRSAIFPIIQPSDFMV